MRRVTVDVDDDLVTEVMRRHGVMTRREAVDLALRKLAGDGRGVPVRQAGVPLTKEFLLSLQGIGWDGDPDEIRGKRTS